VRRRIRPEADLGSRAMLSWTDRANQGHHSQGGTPAVQQCVCHPRAVWLRGGGTAASLNNLGIWPWM